MPDGQVTTPVQSFEITSTPAVQPLAVSYRKPRNLYRVNVTGTIQMSGTGFTGTEFILHNTATKVNLTPAGWTTNGAGTYGKITLNMNGTYPASAWYYPILYRAADGSYSRGAGIKITSAPA